MNSFVAPVQIPSYRECAPRRTFTMLPYKERYEDCGLAQMFLIFGRQHRSMQGGLTAKAGQNGEKISYCGSPELMRMLYEWFCGERAGGAGS